MAAELLGGAIVSAFVEFTIDSLASRFKDYFRGKKLNKELLSKLKNRLQSIDALTDDAEQKQFRDSRVRDWLLQTKEVVFDAEDLLAEIDVELSKCQVEAESKTIVGQVTSFLKSSTVSSFENEMEWMEQILVDIEDLLSQSDNLGLKKNNGVGVGSESGSNESWRSSSTSLPSESYIYGRDDDKENIINWLTSHTGNRLSILSIVGMGGLGKTTLAQLVYNDSKIQGKFDIKAWVYVSDDFDVFKVTRTILERITGSTDDSRDLEMVHTRLKQKLSGKKFLLVLDDVWNEEWNKWEEVKKPLVAFGAEGSRILVTTRNNEVASIMQSKELNLKELQHDHCWHLFAKHAFVDDNLQSISEYYEIGMKIVKKCKGLPLALKSMGSLLRNKSSVSKWQSVLESEVWQLKDNNIVPALALSYLNLPSYHKRCFAYCALFPKDSVFDKEDLIHLWMGENFLLCHEQSRSPENVGEQIFSDLLSRSFFQSSNWIHGFVMHDLLNDLAKFVCGDICCRLGVDRAKRISKTTRHFSFSTCNTKDFDGFGSLHDGERLHTFMPTNWTINYLSCETWQCKVPINDLLSKFRFLRVLSLFCCDKLTEVPQSLGNLKHLCLLDLSHTVIEKLPESTCSLYNLQILKLFSCRHLKELPQNFHKLTNLRYFDLSDTGIDKLPESICSLFNLQILKLNLCSYLKELPSNLHTLTNLHRLEFKETKIRKVPPHWGKLKNLQVCMSSLHVGESEEFTIQQLGELNVYGSLSIENLQNIENPSDALTMGLENKTHLEVLALVWQPMDRNLDDSLKERENNVIEKLKPSKQLKELSIRNYGGTKFPSWLSDNSLWNMVSLKLNKCKSCQRLPSLGTLPFLKKLEIVELDGIVSIDADFYGSEPFSFKSLETLMFSDMKEWERWECEGVTGAFPRLQHLYVENCPKLKGISELGYDSLKTFPLDLFPTLVSLSVSGFPDLQMISLKRTHNNLKELRICQCPELESLPERVDILLSSLQQLVIKDCPKVEWVPGVYLPSNLIRMSLNNCSKLFVSMKGALRANPSLEVLSVGGLQDVESFPDEGLLPLSLACLQIWNFESLKNVEYKGLCHLSSLKQLIIDKCPKLECLPEEGLPKSISHLYIEGCPLLKQRCEEQTGEDWPKIAHIQRRNIR